MRKNANSDFLNTYIPPNEAKGTKFPKKGNPGSKVIVTFSEDERFDALEEFYKEYDGGKYDASFRMEWNVIKKLGELY